MSDITHLEVARLDGAIIAKYAGGTIKRVSANTFEGHGVRWHAPGRMDLTGEWFSSKTYLMRNAGYPIIGIPTNYQHGMQKAFGNLAIGVVSFTTEDEIGQFIRGELKTREDYIAMLQEIGRKADAKFTDIQLGQKADLAIKAVNTLIAEVPLQFSGGFDPSTWLVDPESKHIDQAGMIHLAFTPTPADDLNPMVRFKSAWDEVLKYESSTSYSLPLIQTDGSAAREGGSPEKADRKGDATKADVGPNVQVTPTGVLSMDEQMIATIAAAVAQQVLAGIAPMLNKQEQTPEQLPLEAEVVSSLLKDQTVDPNAKPDELAKAMAEKATKYVLDALEKRRGAAVSAKAIAEAYLKRNLPPVDDLAASGGGNDFGHTKATDVQVMSRYQKWDARDFSFALNIAQLQQGKGRRLIKTNFDQAFFREFADKAAKSYQSGTLHMSDSAVKSVRTIKSDELDYSTQAGYGDEAVPTIWSEDIWERPRQDNVIQNLFESVEMPSNPYEYPVEGSDPAVRYVVETKHEAQLSLDSTTRPIRSSKVGTGKITFTARKFGLQVEWSAELDEDSISRLIPQFRKQAERAMQDKGIDNVAINGDTSTTTNINSDGETITESDRNYLAYDGLIHQALVTATTNRLDAGGVAPTLQHLRAVRSMLGTAEAYNPNNLAWIMDFPTYAKLLNDDNVVTVDKYGAAATVLTGELGRIDGIRVFVSAEMALADADGKVTQTANVVNRGRAQLVHTPSWKMGYRRQTQQSLDFLTWFDMWLLTITMRNHFLPRTATNGTLQSTDDSVGLLYNIAV